ncbi:MAG: hypothetical protein LBS01_11960 [Prevotellaceae bacterium]|jgi:hypothetical protein|nr:hypothetical protein [Prevotellaceae bacterium]
MENKKYFWGKYAERRIENGFHKGFHIFFHFLFGVAFLALFGAVVMWLWNALLPQIFGIVPINFWQALGVLILCRILFSGFSSKHAFAGRGRRHKNRIRRKWQNMTPDERMMCIKRHHCGHDFFNEKDPEKEN